MRFNVTVPNTLISNSSLLACQDCDLIQSLPQLSLGESARCPRCNRELWTRRTDALNRTLALTITAVFLYCVANSVPMLSISAVGHGSSTTVFGGVVQLWTQGQQIVASLVCFCAIIAPALQIGFMLLVVLVAHFEAPPHWLAELLRLHPLVRNWSMIEVMLVGVMVALIKIADLASVVPGLALFTLFTLVFVLAAMQASFDAREVWQRIQWSDREATNNFIPGVRGVS